MCLKRQPLWIFREFDISNICTHSETGTCFNCRNCNATPVIDTSSEATNYISCPICSKEPPMHITHIIHVLDKKHNSRPIATIIHSNAWSLPIYFLFPKIFCSYGPFAICEPSYDSSACFLANYISVRPAKRRK